MDRFWHKVDNGWHELMFQLELATAGAEDVQWVDTLGFFWDSLPDGANLTAKEKRQIAASLKQVVRQQSSDLYHKQEGHKETIRRRQALLAQQHLESLASKRMDELRTMSYMAQQQSRNTSLMLPAASELLAQQCSSSSGGGGGGGAISRQHTPAARQLQHAHSGSSSGGRSSSSGSSGGGGDSSGAGRQWQWRQQQQPLERSRLASTQRLPSVLEQQQQSELLPGTISLRRSEVQPAQPDQQQQPGAVVIDMPSDHFSFLPLAAAASARMADWPAGAAAVTHTATSSSSRGQQRGAVGGWDDTAGSSNGGSSGRGPGEWSFSGYATGQDGQLGEPLLQQQRQQQMHEAQHPLLEQSQPSLAEAATATGAEAEAAGQYTPPILPLELDVQQQQQQLGEQALSAQQLLLQRYLSSSTSSHEPECLASTPTAAAAAGGAGGASGCATPLTDVLRSSQSDHSINSSSSDASSEQLLLPQQQQGFDGLRLVRVNPAGASCKAGVDVGRCSCDTTSLDVDTPKKLQAAGGGAHGCCGCVDGVCAVAACAGEALPGGKQQPQCGGAGLQAVSNRLLC